MPQMFVTHSQKCAKTRSNNPNIYEKKSAFVEPLSFTALESHEVDLRYKM